MNVVNFEYIGKNGKRSGQFVVRVEGELLFGEYDSNPYLVKINGCELKMDDIYGMVYKFSDKMIYKATQLADFLIVLRRSYEHVFKDIDTSGVKNEP